MKKLLVFLLVGLVLAAVLGYAAVVNIDAIAQRYKPQIEAALGDAIGGTLASDAMAVQLLPRPRVELRGVKLSGENAAAIVAAREIALEVELGPLLWRSLQVTSVTVDGAAVSLERTAAGVELPLRAAPARNVDEAPSGGGFFIRLERVEMRDAAVVVHDAESGEQSSFEGIDAAGALKYEGGELRLAPLKVVVERCAGLGRVEAAFDKVSYSAASGELTFEARDAAVGGFRGVAEGRFKAASGEGRIMLRGGGNPLDRIVAAAQPYLAAAPAGRLDELKVVGAAEPNLTIEMLGGGRFRLNGTVALSDGGIDVQGTPIKGIAGTVRLALTEAGGKIALEKWTGSFGERAAALAMEGEFEGAPLRGEVRLTAPALELSDAAPILRRFGAAELPLTAGRGAVKAVWRRRDTGPDEWSVSADVTGGVGVFRGINFQDGAGKLKASGGASPFRLVADRVSLGVSGGKEVVVVSADISGESSEGSFQISSPGVDVRTLAPFLGDTSALGADVGGMARLDIKGRRDGGVSRMRGTVGLSDGRAVLSGYQLSDVAGDITVSDDAGLRFSAAPLALVVNGEPLTVSGDLIQSGAGEWRLGRLKVDGCGGSWLGSGSFSSAPPYRFAVGGAGRGLSIDALERLYGGADEGSALTGTLSEIKFQLSGEGGERLSQTLSGSAAFRLEGGALRGVNIGRIAVEKLASVPIVGDAVISGIPPNYRRAFDEPDTPIRVLAGTAAFRDGRAETDEVKVVSDLFGLAARGAYRLNDAANFTAMLYFDRDFALAFAERVPELRRFFGREGTIAFPLSIKGPPRDLEVWPDIRGLLQMEAERAVEREATRFIDRAIDRWTRGGDAPPEGR